MNGLSVMPCVQAGTLSGYGVYDLGGRLAGQKMIRISRQETMKQKSTRQESTRQERKTDIIISPSEKDAKAKKTRDMKNPAITTRAARKTSAPVPLTVRVLILAVLFAGMIAGFKTMTGASSRAKEQTYKYYTTVTIGYDEDITDLVYQYCDSSEYSTPDAYIREICEINSLPYHKGTVPELSAGTQIVIPYFDTELK